MAKAKFDIATLEIPAVATKPLYAGVGVTDLAVEAVRDYVTDVQKRVVGLQKDVQTRVAGVQKSVTGFEPQTLRKQAASAVNTRRTAVEARVADLQSDAKALPTRLQTTVNENVATLTDNVTDTYADLAQRGEVLVKRIRKQEATQATATAAKTTTAKAKTTKTQATAGAKKTAKTATSSAKKATTTATKSTAPARSSAKATGTAAKKTATKAAQAGTAAAKKVGD